MIISALSKAVLSEIHVNNEVHRSRLWFLEVADIQARGACLCWTAPVRKTVDEEQKEPEEKPEESSISYEVSVLYSGKDDKYNTAYR